MFVLGIDPGLSRCGYGAVRHGRRPTAEAAGVLSTPPEMDRPSRLAELQTDVRALIAELRPDVVAVERVLFQRNVATAMSVGQAVGVVLAESAAAGCGGGGVLAQRGEASGGRLGRCRQAGDR